MTDIRHNEHKMGNGAGFTLAELHGVAMNSGKVPCNLKEKRDPHMSPDKHLSGVDPDSLEVVYHATVASTCGGAPGVSGKERQARGLLKTPHHSS